MDKSQQYDIALIRTNENIQFNELVKPIALPTENTPADIPVIVSGWGLGVSLHLRGFDEL